MIGSRPVVVASIALIIAIPLVTLAAKSNGRRSKLSPQQTTVQYRTEASSLTLAPGWKWPASPVPERTPDEGPLMYGDGWGKQAADQYWFCSWASLAADQQLPATERQQALEQVLSIRTKYFYTKSLATESKPAFNQLLDTAADSNTEKLRRYYELNCQKNP